MSMFLYQKTNVDKFFATLNKLQNIFQAFVKTCKITLQLSYEFVITKNESWLTLILVVLIVTAFIAYVKDTVCIKNVELLIVMANPIF